MRTLTGKRVLITGAASGIGYAMARRFAEEGAHIVLTDIDEPLLSRAATSLRESGREVAEYRLDVTDQHEVAAVRERINAEGGPIDVLVNNAGTVFGGDFLDVPLASHLTTLDVNLRGPILVTHAFLPDLLTRPDAHVVGVASLAGLAGAPGAATYAATKWGVIGLDESLELELQRQGRAQVHVTTVCPGLVSTELFAGAQNLRLFPRLAPEAVADLVVRAVLADRPYVRTPFMVTLVPALRAALPHRAFTALVGLLGGHDVMTRWQGPGQRHRGPGALTGLSVGGAQATSDAGA
jgi:all-trans-retinol dehydrogenase (NAD+)